MTYVTYDSGSPEALLSHGVLGVGTTGVPLTAASDGLGARHEICHLEFKP